MFPQDRGSEGGGRAFGRIVLCRWDARGIAVLRCGLMGRCVPGGRDVALRIDGADRRKMSVDRKKSMKLHIDVAFDEIVINS